MESIFGKMEKSMFFLFQVSPFSIIRQYGNVSVILNNLLQTTLKSSKYCQSSSYQFKVKNCD